jgi:membrane protease YdiL (CAAX protease family)
MARPGTAVWSESITSKQHTVGLLLIIVMFSFSSRLLLSHQSTESLQQFGNARIYCISLASEWVMFAYLLLGLRLQVKSVRESIDESPWTVGRWTLYVAIAVGTAVTWMMCGFVLAKVLRLGPHELGKLRILLPHSAAEKAVWLVLSVSTGFCEEFVYRGYLQQQFSRWTGRLYVGVVLQAAVYGVAHAALPWKLMVLVTCLGLLLGGVATWRKTLVPGMLLHASFDTLAGLLSR